MTVDHEGLTLTSVGFDVGQAEEQVSCTYTGEPVKVFVNASTFSISSVRRDAEVEIQIRDGDGPVVMLRSATTSASRKRSTSSCDPPVTRLSLRC